MRGTLEFRPNLANNADDPLRVWVRPDAADRYVIGADVAEGLEHGDYSCGQVLSISTGQQVAMWHGHIPPDEFADELSKLGRFYNQALVGVEANNHGLTTVTALRNLRYPAIYRERTLDKVTNKATQRFGWFTSRTSKPMGVDELAMALKAGELCLYDKRTLAELRTYVRDEKGHTHGSPHDDTVMALMIANQMRKFVFVPEQRETQDDYLTMEWWKRQITNANASKMDWQLGKNNQRGR
jgi:hypothetical protein